MILWIISSILLVLQTQIRPFMFSTLLSSTIFVPFLIEQISTITILAIIGFTILVLMILGVIKFFKSKAKNGYLSKISFLQSEEDNRVYKNFTEGHLYDSF